MPDYDANSNDFKYLSKTLKTLYGEKQSAVSPYVELFKIKQQPFQSLKDYLSAVRINGIKALQSQPPIEREKFLVMCFINGLASKKYAHILNEIKPTNLCEAYNLIKNEKLDENVDKSIFAIEEENDSKQINWQNKIEKLESKIFQLEREIKSLKEINGKKQFNNNTKKLSDIKCFNCNRVGHFARDCFQRVTQCTHCGMKGHISKNCRRKSSFKRPNVRQMRMQSDSVQSEVDVLDIQNNGETAADYFEEECVQTNEGRVMSISSPTQCDVNSTKKQCEERQRKPLYSKVIQNWAQFINGEGNKPKQSLQAETIISRNYQETARGKAIIKTKIGSEEISVLMDTGSDCNVIDMNLFKLLAKSDRSLKILPKKHNLSCANGTKLVVIGYTNLNGEYDFTDTGAIAGANQRIDANVNTWNFSAVVSTRKIPVINFYGGLGYIVGKSETDFLGTYEVATVPGIPIVYNDPFSITNDVSGVTANIGTKINYFTISAIKVHFNLLKSYFFVKLIQK